MNYPIRILLVDDSTYFLDVAREFLELQEPFVVAGTATDGPEAIIQAIKLRPDLILLDLNIGNRSGLDLIPIFRVHLPEAKIIVLTIMSDASYRAAAQQVGADAFVHKSEMTETLFSIIRELAGPPAS